MKTTNEILDILNELENHIADDFEEQELDFKEWNEKSINDSVNLVVKMAVCMANGGVVWLYLVLEIELKAGLML